MCCARHGPNLLSITVCCVIWHANPPILPDWNGYRLLNAVGGNDNYMTGHWSLPRVNKKERINELNTLHLFDDEGKQYQMWHLAGDQSGSVVKERRWSLRDAAGIHCLILSNSQVWGHLFCPPCVRASVSAGGNKPSILAGRCQHRAYVQTPTYKYIPV